MDRRIMTVLVAGVVAAFVIAVPWTQAQVIERQQPRLERPPIRVDPRTGPRPELRIDRANIQFRAQLDEGMLERARAMRVYRLERPRLDGATMGRVGADLGLRGEMTRFDTMITQTSGDAGFMMLDQETGRLAFNVNLAELLDGTPTDLPSEPEAAQIALDFLRQHDLMPDSDQAVVAHIGRIRSATFDPGTNTDSGPMDQALVVYFARQVDGFRVVGPGSTAVVQIGAGGGGAAGRIAGGGVQWAALGQPTELDPAQLRGAEALLTDIRDFLSREHWMASRIVVDEIGVFYYDAGGFLQPVVGYQAQITTGELDYQFFGQVAMLERPPVRVGPEPVSAEMRERLQQPPRDGGR